MPPLPTAGSPAARLGSIPQSSDVPDFPVAGKNAGNFVDSSAFYENFVSKTSANSAVCEMNSLLDVAGYYFARAGNQFRLLDRNREFSQNRSARPDTSKADPDPQGAAQTIRGPAR